MSVKKHPTIEGAWLIDWWEPNLDKPANPKTGNHPPKRHYETYVGTHDEAMSRWADLAQRHKSVHRRTVNMRIGQAIPDYLAFIELNKSKGYYQSWCWAVKKIGPFFGQYPVSSITTKLIEDFKRLHRTTPRHCNQCLQYLKIMITWMVGEGKAQPLPFKIVMLQHTEALPQPPSPAEYEQILDTIRENFKKSGTTLEQRAIQEALVRTIYSTGIRMAEARLLSWNNLRWEDGRCLVAVTKTGLQRFCIIPAEVLEILKPYKKKHGYIFVNPATGKPYTTIRALLKNAAAKHGIPMRGPHDLRHAAGTDTLEATGDLRATQNLLGHATLKSTQRYTTIAVRRQHRVAEQTALFRKQMLDEEKAAKKKAASKKIIDKSTEYNTTI